MQQTKKYTDMMNAAMAQACGKFQGSNVGYFWAWDSADLRRTWQLLQQGLHIGSGDSLHLQWGFCSRQKFKLGWVETILGKERAKDLRSMFYIQVGLDGLMLGLSNGIAYVKLFLLLQWILPAHKPGVASKQRPKSN